MFDMWTQIETESPECAFCDTLRVLLGIGPINPFQIGNKLGHLIHKPIMLGCCRNFIIIFRIMIIVAFSCHSLWLNDKNRFKWGASIIQTSRNCKLARSCIVPCHWLNGHKHKSDVTRLQVSMVLHCSIWLATEESSVTLHCLYLLHQLKTLISQ